MFLPCPSDIRLPEGNKNGLKTRLGVLSIFRVFLEISTFVHRYPSVRPGSGWAIFCAENLS